MTAEEQKALAFASFLRHAAIFVFLYMVPAFLIASVILTFNDKSFREMLFGPDRPTPAISQNWWEGERYRLFRSR